MIYYRCCLRNRYMILVKIDIDAIAFNEKKYKLMIRDLASVLQTRDGCNEKNDGTLKKNDKSEY